GPSAPPQEKHGEGGRGDERHGLEARVARRGRAARGRRRAGGRGRGRRGRGGRRRARGRVGAADHEEARHVARVDGVGGVRVEPAVELVRARRRGRGERGGLAPLLEARVPEAVHGGDGVPFALHVHRDGGAGVHLQRLGLEGVVLGDEMGARLRRGKRRGAEEGKKKGKRQGAHRTGSAPWRKKAGAYATWIAYSLPS